MIKKQTLIRWMRAFGICVLLSIPFWVLWTALGLGASCGSFLPRQFQSISFIDCLGLFTVLGLLKSLFAFVWLVIRLRLVRADRRGTIYI